ncbi:MAG: hypothetical protein WC548_01580 [Candidatus Pacearchaeota archaeon]
MILGSKVLEEVLTSINNSQNCREETFREIIMSRSDSVIRTIVQSGTVFGVCEFSSPVINPEYLIGKEFVGGKEKVGYDRKTFSHFYAVAKNLRQFGSTYISPKVLVDYFTDDWPRIFKAAPAFDAIREVGEVGFNEGLKPTVTYSIVAPAVKINLFPVGGWRSCPAKISEIEGTAIINLPYEVIPNKDIGEALGLLEVKTREIGALTDFRFYYKQAARVLDALANNKSFKDLATHILTLSQQLDKEKRKMHSANIGKP